jgi:peptide chain release factor 1
MTQSLPDINYFKKRYELTTQQMSAADFFNDRRKAAQVGRENQKLSELLKLYEDLEKTKKTIQDNQHLLNDPTADAELKEFAAEELNELKAAEETISQKVLYAMLPSEEQDSRNTVIEIRAGAGGDEASLFVAALYRMYTHYSEHNKWTIETLKMNPSECGGFKEVIFLVSGEEVYRMLKFESGVHRVQRVPATEANGRIHTSTVTVAVLPEAEEVDLHINPSDLEISVCRASGPGGQGVNTTDSAVQILYKPTGMIVVCADERSQQKNRVKAMMVLRSRLLKAKEEEERAKYAATRKNQIGSGDRSERIRTYNFPDNRLTDHRINLNLFNLPDIMDGNIHELIEALHKADKEIKVHDMIQTCANG